MIEASYKLAKAAGGSSHFAQVGLRLVEPSETNVVEFSNVEMREIKSSWLESAIRGAQDAINSTNLVSEFMLEEITELSGLLSDTNDNTMWCAAFMAATKAMSVEEPQPVYNQNQQEWGIHLNGHGMVYMEKEVGRKRRQEP